MSKRVLVPLGSGFEEIETVTPVDLLRRAGVEVVLASLEDDLLVKGRSNLTLLADVKLGDVLVEKFDLLFIPGGPGVKAMRGDGRVADLARDFAARGRFVAAICAAPTILADVGLLESRRFTAHFSVHGELPAALGDERVVQDGNLLTSRGAGTALDFGLYLITILCGEDESAKVAASIMA